MRLRATSVGLAVAVTLALPLAGEQPRTREQAYQALVGRGLASMIRGGAVAPRWLGDGNSFWYTEQPGDSVAAWRVDPATNTRVPLLDKPSQRPGVGGSL